MVVYNVHTSHTSYKYKTYLCSKATIVLVIISVLTIFFPIIFTFRSQGFWAHSDTYIEQPVVSFKYDYILIANLEGIGGTILCSNLQQLQYLQDHNICPFLNVREEDLNGDGISDVLYFNTQIALTENESIHGITVLLFFDYKLSSYCRVQMETMAVLQHESVKQGAGLSAVGELSWVQRRPLSPRHLDTSYNFSVVSPSTVFTMPEVLTQYSHRHMRAQLTNVYSSWITEQATGDLFTLQATIFYSEAVIRYKPTAWQLLHSVWVQLFPALVVSILVFRAVKEFIFSNQLVYTYKEVPWKKIQ